jgi:hypothetical protein
MKTSPARHFGSFPLACLAGLLVVLAGSLPVTAQPMRDLVEAALDQKVAQKIEISERPIREALTALEKATGLHFELAPNALEGMPAGDQTRLSLVIADMSVRDALRRIFDGLGLALRVDNDKVIVEPAPVLDRLGRRLTIEEVGLLQKLAAGPWSSLKPEDFAIEFRLSPKGDPQKAFEQAMREGPAASALAKLEEVTQGMGALWVPKGHTIVIYGREEDVQQRLDRPLDLSYRKTPLDELLLELGKRIGITVHFQPGVLRNVDARERNVELVQRGISARQALELIMGSTGLVYEVVEDGIVVSMPPAGGAQPSADSEAGAKGKVVAILRVPVGTDGTTIDFLIREADLPAEFKDLFKQKMPQVIEILRQKAGSQ